MGDMVEQGISNVCLRLASEQTQIHTLEEARLLLVQLEGLERSLQNISSELISTDADLAGHSGQMASVLQSISLITYLERHQDSIVATFGDSPGKETDSEGCFFSIKYRFLRLLERICLHIGRIFDEVPIVIGGQVVEPTDEPEEKMAMASYWLQRSLTYNQQSTDGVPQSLHSSPNHIFSLRDRAQTLLRLSNTHVSEDERQAFLAQSEAYIQEALTLHPDVTFSRDVDATNIRYELLRIWSRVSKNQRELTVLNEPDQDRSRTIEVYERLFTVHRELMALHDQMHPVSEDNWHQALSNESYGFFLSMVRSAKALRELFKDAGNRDQEFFWNRQIYEQTRAMLEKDHQAGMIAAQRGMTVKEVSPLQHGMEIRTYDQEWQLITRSLAEAAGQLSRMLETQLNEILSSNTVNPGDDELKAMYAQLIEYSVSHVQSYMDLVGHLLNGFTDSDRSDEMMDRRRELAIKLRIAAATAFDLAQLRHGGRSLSNLSHTKSPLVKDVAGSIPDVYTYEDARAMLCRARELLYPVDQNGEPIEVDGFTKELDRISSLYHKVNNIITRRDQDIEQY